MRIVLAALLLVGCHRDKAGEGEGETGSPEAPPCDVSTFSELWPGDALSPASRSIRIQASFSGDVLPTDEGEVTVTVTDAEGGTVDGVTTLSEGALSWQPTELLAEDAAYTWTVQVCEASGGGSFTTGTWGEHVDPAELPDTAFSLDLSNATWVQPANGGSIFSSVFDGLLLLGVEASDDASIDLIAAIGQEYEDEYGTLVQQDPCYATADFEASDFRNNPYATVGPTTLSLDIEGYTVPLQNVYVSGAFVGGTAVADATLAAELDMREAADSFGATASQLCDLLESYAGLDCIACLSDDKELCVSLELKDINGQIVDGLRVVPNEDPQECATDTGR